MRCCTSSVALTLHLSDDPLTVRDSVRHLEVRRLKASLAAEVDEVRWRLQNLTERITALLLHSAGLSNAAANPATKNTPEAAVLKPDEDRVVFILPAAAAVAGKAEREAAGKAAAWRRSSSSRCLDDMPGQRGDPVRWNCLQAHLDTVLHQSDIEFTWRNILF